MKNRHKFIFYMTIILSLLSSSLVSAQRIHLPSGAVTDEVEATIYVYDDRHNYPVSAAEVRKGTVFGMYNDCHIPSYANTVLTKNDGSATVAQQGTENDAKYWVSVKKEGYREYCEPLLLRFDGVNHRIYLKEVNNEGNKNKRDGEHHNNSGREINMLNNEIKYWNSVNGLHYYQVTCANDHKLMIYESAQGSSFGIMTNGGRWVSSNYNASGYVDFANWACSNLSRDSLYQINN